MPDFTITLTAGQISKIQQLRDDARAQAGDPTLTSAQVVMEILRREWLSLRRRERQQVRGQDEIVSQQQDDISWVA